MKKIVTLLFFLSLFSSNICFSQSGWVWSYPYPTGNHLHSVAVVNATTYFTVGRYGTLLKTTNSGQNWQHQLNYSTDELNSVQFIDQNTGYVAGTEWSSPSKGVVYKTTNCGVSWMRYIAAEVYDIKCMKFLNVNTGYLSGSGSGGSVLKTVNGGINWVVLPTGFNFIINSISFVNVATGYIAGDIGVFKTSNGGNNWSQVYTNSFGSLYSISFADSLSGVVSGYMQYYPFTLVTTNGGISWSSHYMPTSIYSIFFVNQFTGFACGIPALILKSTNSGQSWFIQFQEQGSSFYGIHFVDSLFGMAVGSDGEILRTINGGSNWTVVTPKAVPEYTLKIRFINQNTGFAVGDYYLLKTTNSAFSWDIIRLNATIIFKDLTIIDSSLYVCGYMGTILKSTDFGINWTSRNAGSNILRCIFFVNNETGFCGNDSTVYKTTDGGNIWINLNASGSFRSIYFVNENTGFAVGYLSGFKTIDGGASWTALPSNVLPASSIYFMNSVTGFTTNNNYQIKKTTDGGNLWFTVTSSNISASFTTIYFANERVGFAVGSLGRVVKTTNTGNNWFDIYSPTDKTFYSVCTTDSNTCYIGGGYRAIILKTTSGGMPININGIGLHIPQSPSLSQNYPNPFNPVTRIKYDIPLSRGLSAGRGVLVKLIVYDILGREIETLVNESQKPGSYEVTWDGSRCASGVYFYRLYTDEYAETKKMVLIK